MARALAPRVRDAASTRFAFVGPRLSDLGLADVPNGPEGMSDVYVTTR